MLADIIDIKEVVSWETMLVGYLTRPSENQTKPSESQNIEKMLSDNYLLPPHLSRALRKWAASGGKHPARKVHIQVGKSTGGVDESSTGALVHVSTLNCHIIITVI